jgi:membrane associated rhomboid family serine protease
LLSNPQDNSAQAPEDALVGTPESRPRIGKRLLTLLVCAISTFVFLGLLRESNPNSWETLSRWGALPADAVWGGKYWVLVTSVFVHVAWWHLAFNVYWLWLLGGALEEVIGSLRWLAFFLSAAVVSSGIELAFAGTTGIGLSGVVYAVFGFMWLSQKRFPKFQAVITRPRIQLFLLWLVACVVATVLRVWRVGNAAHIAGLVFGMAIAGSLVLERGRNIVRLAAVALLIASIVPLFWCPWSVEWVTTKALHAYDKGDYATAIRELRRSADLGADRVWVFKNLALAYFSRGDHTQYKTTLNLLRKMNDAAARDVEQRVSGRGEEPGRSKR